jgi:hypothetical protein
VYLEGSGLTRAGRTSFGPRGLTCNPAVEAVGIGEHQHEIELTRTYVEVSQQEATTHGNLAKEHLEIA